MGSVILFTGENREIKIDPNTERKNTLLCYLSLHEIA